MSNSRKVIMRIGQDGAEIKIGTKEKKRISLIEESSARDEPDTSDETGFG